MCEKPYKNQWHSENMAPTIESLGTFSIPKNPSKPSRKYPTHLKKC